MPAADVEKTRRVAKPRICEDRVIDPLHAFRCHSNIQVVGVQPLTTCSNHRQKRRFSIVSFYHGMLNKEVYFLGIILLL